MSTETMIGVNGHILPTNDEGKYPEHISTFGVNAHIDGARDIDGWGEVITRKGWGGIASFMRGVAAIFAPLVLVVGLGACTASDAIVARELTIVDGAAYVAENHARRQEVRRELYAFENEVISACKDWARAAKFDEDVTEAQRRINVCLDFIQDSYPDLATIEALREGADGLNDLRSKFRGE